jgi:RNA polymerase sigma-70 factor (ECF subfamily)
MLGSMADAEDAVQETYLRWHRTDSDKVLNPASFLVTTAMRICIDMLTSARARREEYVGPWLPEPVLDSTALAPDSHTELAEDLSVALLLTSSGCRRSSAPPSCCTTCSTSRSRKWPRCWSGARSRVASLPPAHASTCARFRPRGAIVPPAHLGELDPEHARLLSAFMAATQSGDLDAITRFLASDVRVMSDGGGKVALDAGSDPRRGSRGAVDRGGHAWWTRGHLVAR